MRKFEHQTVFMPVPIPSEMIDYLNQEGVQGWEAVSMTFVHGTFNNQVQLDENNAFLSNAVNWHGPQLVVLMKREITE